MVEDILMAPASGQPHFCFFHHLSNAPSMTVGALSGTYTFDVQANGSSVLNLPDIMLQAGKIYTVFAKGLVNGTGSQALGAQIITHN